MMLCIMAATVAVATSAVEIQGVKMNALHTFVADVDTCYIQTFPNADNSRYLPNIVKYDFESERRSRDVEARLAKIERFSWMPLASVLAMLIIAAALVEVVLWLRKADTERKP